MGEGYVQKFIRGIQSKLIGWFLFSGLFVLLSFAGLYYFIDIPLAVIVAIVGGTWLVLAVMIGWLVGKAIARPTEYIAQSILHIAPSEHLVPAPNVETLAFGKEMVDTLSRQIYAFATNAQQVDSAGANPLQGIVNQVSVPLLGIAADGKIGLINESASTTFPIEGLLGKDLQSALQFIGEDASDIDSWLSEHKQSLRESKRWPKVEVKTPDGRSLGYFDIAMSYNQHSASGFDTVITCYDHSDVYNQEESSTSFVALAVHELRTPLTIMRGYIEAFESELGDSSSEQIKDDLRKMNASAESLSSFVSTILNVARVNDGQLSLTLRQDNWNIVLPQIIDSLRNRAAVHGKELELRMQPDLPPTGIDRTTIGEVVTNLIENAIKYSPDEHAKKIMVVSKLNPEGLIETTVTDQGIGIPESVMPHLFNKFYRNHRSRATVRGTGLGLYVSKAIVTAHHGNIWANSKEGQGSTFGFTLIPYDQLASDQQTSNNESIVRGSHGWIKNHSMQRR